MDNSDTQRWKKSSDIIEREIDGEAVLLDLKSGVYYSLNRIGTEIWEMLSAGASEDQLVETLISTYEVSAEQAKCDLEELLTDLSEEGLITRDTESGQ